MCVRRTNFVILSFIVIISVASKSKGESKTESLCDTQLKTFFINLEKCGKEVEDTYYKEKGKKIDLRRLEEVQKKPSADITNEELATGCLILCAFENMNAVNSTGYPLVEALYSGFIDGSTEEFYRETVIQSVSECVPDILKMLEMYKDVPPKELLGCRASFALFHCITGQLYKYCN